MEISLCKCSAFLRFIFISNLTENFQRSSSLFYIRVPYACVEIGNAIRMFKVDNTHVGFQHLHQQERQTWKLRESDLQAARTRRPQEYQSGKLHDCQVVNNYHNFNRHDYQYIWVILDHQHHSKTWFILGKILKQMQKHLKQASLTMEWWEICSDIKVWVCLGYKGNLTCSRNLQCTIYRMYRHTLSHFIVTKINSLTLVMLLCYCPDYKLVYWWFSNYNTMLQIVKAYRYHDYSHIDFSWANNLADTVFNRIVQELEHQPE